MIGDRTLFSPLTEEEKKLVESHHNLIYKVIHDYRLIDYLDDIYGDAALMMMQCARKYNNRSELRKYAFSSIVYISVCNVCKEYIKRVIISRHKYVSLDNNDMDLYDKLEISDGYQTGERSIEYIQLQSRISCILTEKEYQAIQRCADGLSATDVEQMYGVKDTDHRNALERARKKCRERFGKRGERLIEG